MKKITIQEFAKQLRERYPTKFKNLSDIDLVSKWIKLRPSSVEALQYTERAKLLLDDGLKYTESEIQRMRGTKKVQPPKNTPQPTDTTTPSDTTTQNDGNWMGDVIDRIKQAKEKLKSNTQPQQQPSNTPAPEQKKVAPAYSSTFKSKPCDENTFPWTRGCMNNKIGQMNQIYFGDRYGNIYGDDLYYQLRSLGYFAAQGQKDGEITQYIYDGVLKDSLQESDNFERKKIVKETVKNVLKERLKNN